MPKFYTIVVFLLTTFFASNIYSQINVSANLNVKHTVGNISEFDRSKFIVIHANQIENEWDGDNFTSDLRNDFLNGYDVYLGRDTGGITWNLNNMSEDPDRPGYAKPSEITSKGLNTRNSFENNTNLHQYEERKNATIAGQLHPFWTGEGQQETNNGWKLASATATGEYMGRYINEFHGSNGQKTPSYVEIINEPAYESMGGKLDYTHSIEEIADFHVEVADAIRVQAPNLKIGGYTTAFPDFEVGDFQRWENRWKMFMDIAGEKMDFWSIHLYDFASIRGGEKELRSGSNVEATFDMMEHYSKLSFNEIKPIVISEYGAQTHDYNNQTWTPYRDWLHLKASNSLLMSFLERPQNIASAINFIIVKAEWGYNSTLDIPYPSRLMRKANEPEEYTGEWVYTDMVKFFQLWQNVKGTRIDTTSDDLDLQVDAYIDGTKGYLILNNLDFTEHTINLNLFDSKNENIVSILKRHLTLVNETPILDEETFTSPITSVTIGAESTIILEYTFENEIDINKTSNEVKYYAETYYKPISANQEQNFNINNVSKDTYGEAVLRIGVGREHGKILHPSIKVNGKTIDVPTDWRGYDQAQRERFFGVLEIPVPFDVLEVNNSISVSFSDNGGHISSVALQVFNFSDNIRVFNPTNLPATNYQIKTTSATCIDSDNGKIEIATGKTLNYKAEITSNNYNKILDFSNSLNIENLKTGTYTIKITIPEYPDYSIEFSIEISEPDNLLVSSKIDKSNNTVSFQLSGSKSYTINLNGNITTTTLDKINLPLNYGKNEVSITTDKECQGKFNQSLFLEKNLTIYPNPAMQKINVSIPSEMVGGEISILAINGTIIKTIKINNEKQSIKISELPQGVYIINANKNNITNIQSKLIVQNK